MTNGEPGDYWHEHFSADEMCKFINISDRTYAKSVIDLLIISSFYYRYIAYTDVLLHGVSTYVSCRINLFRGIAFKAFAPHHIQSFLYFCGFARIWNISKQYCLC